MIVDTHTHVVAPDERAYPLDPRPLSGEWYRKAPHSAEELRTLMRESGVDRAVLVQPVGAYGTDSSYAADSAAQHPAVFAAACCVDPAAPDPAAELARWARERGVSGIRIFCIGRDAVPLDHPGNTALVGAAAELGIHVIVTLLSPQLPHLAKLLARFPQVAISLDHCGFPPLTDTDWASAEPLFRLCEHANLHLKVSTHVLDAAAGAGDTQGFVGAVVGRFGAERVMWGSDFCQTHDRSYAELVSLGRQGFAALAPEQRDACLGATALRLWPSLGGESRA